MSCVTAVLEIWILWSCLSFAALMAQDSLAIAVLRAALSPALKGDRVIGTLAYVVGG